MSGQAFLEPVRHLAQVLALIPPPFLAGMIWGLVLGIVITSIVAGRSGVMRVLQGLGRGLIAIAPATLACLLWGAWIGILAAKTGLH
jgi:flagellar biosynthesis protein FliQ